MSLAVTELTRKVEILTEKIDQLNSLIGGSGTTSDNLNALIKELNEQRIGNVSTPDTLNYLVNQLNIKLDTTNTKLGDATTDDTVIYELNQTVSKLGTLISKLGDETTDNTVIYELDQTVSKLTDTISQLQTLNSKIGDVSTADTLNYLVNQLNDKMNTLNNKIGDVSTQDTVLERLQKVINQLGDTATTDTLIYLIKDLNENRIGSVDDEDTLNYLIEKLKKVISKQLGGSLALERSISGEEAITVPDRQNSASMYDDVAYLVLYYSANTPPLRVEIWNALTGKHIGYQDITTQQTYEPQQYEAVAIDKTNGKLYLIYATDDLVTSGSYLVVEEYTINSDYTLTYSTYYTFDISSDLSAQTPSVVLQYSEKIQDAHYFNGILYVYLTNFVVKINLSTSTATVEPTTIYTELCDAGGKNYFLFKVSGKNVYKVDEDNEVDTKFSLPTNPYEMLGVIDDNTIVFIELANGEQPIFYVYSVVSKVPDWWVNSAKTTDDIYNRLANITNLTFDANNYLKINLSADDLGLKTAIESQQPRRLYGYDGSSWVPLKTTSEGKVLAVLG